MNADKKLPNSRRVVVNRIFDEREGSRTWKITSQIRRQKYLPNCLAHCLFSISILDWNLSDTLNKILRTIEGKNGQSLDSRVPLSTIIDRNIFINVSKLLFSLKREKRWWLFSTRSQSYKKNCHYETKFVKN